MSSDNLETRTRILNATWKLLEADQGHGVRMSDIAKQAGISRQAVYLHFPTRSKLLIATTRYLDDIKGIEARTSRDFSGKLRAGSAGELLLMPGETTFPKSTALQKPCWP